MSARPRSKLVASLGVMAVVAACSDRAPTIRTGTRADAIIGGTLDTTHGAVVLVRSAPDNGGFHECTGTFVKIDATTGVGWVLTGGHCVTNWKPRTVLAGADPNAPSARSYAVLDSFTEYTGQPEDGAHDVAIVRVLGVDPSVPTIPLAQANDGLSEAASVESIGYGRTTAVGTDPAPQARRHITRTLSALGSSFMRYAMSDGGVCSGDSGGPVLFDDGAGVRIVGVHSYVDPDCEGIGTSVRVASELGFLQAKIAAPLPALDSCQACAMRAESGNNTCALRRDACSADAACQRVMKCRASCASQACADECLEENADGAGAFLAFQACSCHETCASACAAVAGCKSIPACGRPAPKDDACAACGEAKCCAERRALSYAPSGWTCGESTASCGGGARDTYDACLAKSCSSECAARLPNVSGEADASTTASAPPAAAPAASSADEGGCNVGRTQRQGASSLWSLFVACAACAMFVRRVRS